MVTAVQHIRSIETLPIVDVKKKIYKTIIFHDKYTVLNSENSFVTLSIEITILFGKEL